MLTYLHPEAVKKFLDLGNLKNVRISIPYLSKIGKTFQNIPYENMSKIIRSHSISDPSARIRMPEMLFEEYLRFGTGGTCFSMTYFIQTILRSIGFETYPVMADRPLAPNTHCASIVVFDGKKYILDPGFMIDQPLMLTMIPTRYDLKHNSIIIGLRGTIPTPLHQLKYFEDLKQKSGQKTILPYEKDTNEYTIATSLKGKTDIRYFLKDEPVSEEKFLEFWLDSFNWPTLRNISITTATENGYIYARNSFLRTTTKKDKKQERVKKELDLRFGKVFNIDRTIIKKAFEILRTEKCQKEQRRSNI